MRKKIVRLVFCPIVIRLYLPPGWLSVLDRWYFLSLCVCLPMLFTCLPFLVYRAVHARSCFAGLSACWFACTILKRLSAPSDYMCLFCDGFRLSVCPISLSAFVCWLALVACSCLFSSDLCVFCLLKAFVCLSLVDSVFLKYLSLVVFLYGFFIFFCFSPSHVVVHPVQLIQATKY